MMIFQEPVRMQVMHQEYGIMETMARTTVEAKLQAMTAWDCSDGFEKFKVAVERAAMEGRK